MRFELGRLCVSLGHCAELHALVTKQFGR